jgi:hypothetical protein
MHPFFLTLLKKHRKLAHNGAQKMLLNVEAPVPKLNLCTLSQTTFARQCRAFWFLMRKQCLHVTSAMNDVQNKNVLAFDAVHNRILAHAEAPASGAEILSA